MNLHVSICKFAYFYVHYLCIHCMCVTVAAWFHLVEVLRLSVPLNCSPFWSLVWNLFIPRQLYSTPLNNHPDRERSSISFISHSLFSCFSTSAPPSCEPSFHPLTKPNSNFRWPCITIPCSTAFASMLYTWLWCVYGVFYGACLHWNMHRHTWSLVIFFLSFFLSTYLLSPTNFHQTSCSNMGTVLLFVALCQSSKLLITSNNHQSYLFGHSRYILSFHWFYN